MHGVVKRRSVGATVAWDQRVGRAVLKNTKCSVQWRPKKDERARPKKDGVAHVPGRNAIFQLFSFFLGRPVLKNNSARGIVRFSERAVPPSVQFCPRAWCFLQNVSFCMRGPLKINVPAPPFGVTPWSHTGVAPTFVFFHVAIFPHSRFS